VAAAALLDQIEGRTPNLEGLANSRLVVRGSTAPAPSS
jgi:DNA-binding LacI/PurR family transcriptional regulator